MLTLATLRVCASLAMLCAAWLGLRVTVGAGLQNKSRLLLALDAAPLMIAWIWLCCVLRRPLLTGTILCLLSLVLACGSAAKRRSSNEPLVFSDRDQATIFFYPALYAELVHSGWLIGWAVILVGSLVLAGYSEPPVIDSPLPALLCTVAVVSAWLSRPSSLKLQGWAGEAASGYAAADPAESARQMGLVGNVILQAAIAAAERPDRRRPHPPCRSAALPFADDFVGPVVMVQLESFFDARRCWDGVPVDLLPAFDRCVAKAAFHGCLETPAWGANTVRTEFAALTGLSGEMLGLDRFNPYAAFARVPVDSIAWRLRSAGFRTVCLHPFDRRFYGRDRVLPNLGFDVFLDIADFPTPCRSQRYVPDSAVLQKIEALLGELGPRTFVFAITMGNHSPWQRLAPPAASAEKRDPAFDGYLQGLRMTDAALGRLAGTLAAEWPESVLAAFGDHQPSLSRRYSRAPRLSWASDYVVMRAGAGAPRREDLAAHDLPGMVLRLADGARFDEVPAAPAANDDVVAGAPATRGKNRVF